MCWAYTDGADQLDVNNDNVKEDAKTRKRRIQAELSQALAVLGIKNSTFYSMLNQNQHAEVRKMLKIHLQERCDYLIEKYENELLDKDVPKDDIFDIDLEIADMTTVHEAYQFLIKKYIDGKESVQSDVFVDIQKLKEKRRQKLMRSSAPTKIIEPPTIKTDPEDLNKNNEEANSR